MDKIQFEGGTKISDAKVTINGVDYIVTPAEYSGNTPLSAYILNLLQTNIEKSVVPIGGTTGQILVKKSNTDNDVEWKNSSSAINIVDNLNSSSSTDGLSARQGKVLNNKFNYSTTEQRIGTWIDNKPLYRKVTLFTLTTTHENEQLTLPHGISNLKMITDFKCIIPTGNGTGYILPFTNMSGASTSVEKYNGQYIYIDIKNDEWGAGRSFYMIMEYTKTTD